MGARVRRGAAALVSLVLLVASLALVPHGPASAAETAWEVLAPDGSREFAGADRYETAVRLAENFARSQQRLSAVIVVSGESLEESVSATPLAGHLNAPILFTRHDVLHPLVAEFISSQSVPSVLVAGGPAAVSDDVVAALEGLVHSPAVERVAGADRYETAVALASRLPAEGAEWCGGGEPAAVLANGGDVSLTGAMAAGPMASRMGVPVLLTRAADLPAATAGFLSERAIGHVVIVGGDGEVSADVVAAVRALGVAEVERIDGRSASRTSVLLADLALGFCRAALGSVSNDTVALVRGDLAADGIAAAGVLARTYRAGALVPMLLVGEHLDPAVSRWLRETPSHVHLRIVVVGGTAAVGDQARRAVLVAAEGLPGTSSRGNGGGGSDGNGGGNGGGGNGGGGGTQTPRGITGHGVPGAPTGLYIIDVDDGQITVGWTAPAHTGSSAITGYILRLRAPGLVGNAYADPGATSMVIDGLDNDRGEYAICVLASNQQGDSPCSNWVSATPRAS